MASFTGFRSRLLPFLAMALSATSLAAQNAQLIPPDLDPTIWGRAGEPYIATVEVTFTPSGIGPASQKPVITKQVIYRDESGRTRIESLSPRDSRLTGYELRDPGENSVSIVYPGRKEFIATIRPKVTNPSGTAWSVEPLLPQKIAGIEAEGHRFTRKYPLVMDGPTGTQTEDIWASPSVGIVLERRLILPGRGTTIYLVTSVDRTIPDPSLFTIPGDYTNVTPGIHGAIGPRTPGVSEAKPNSASQ